MAYRAVSWVDRRKRLGDVGSAAIAGVAQLSKSYYGDADDGVQGRRQQNQTKQQLEALPSTSVVVERISSSAKLADAPLRLGVGARRCWAGASRCFGIGRCNFPLRPGFGRYGRASDGIRGELDSGPQRKKRG